MHTYAGIYTHLPAGTCLLKEWNGNTRTMCEIYTSLTIKTRERRHLPRCSVFINNF